VRFELTLRYVIDLRKILAQVRGAGEGVVMVTGRSERRHGLSRRDFLVELAAVIPLITPIRTYGMTRRLHEVQGDATGANAFPMTDPWLES
jgi:hypothetical protein